MNSDRFPGPDADADGASSMNLSFIRAAVVAPMGSKGPFVRDALTAAGFEVDLFPSAAAGIPSIREQLPSLLVIVDLPDFPDAPVLLEWLGQQTFRHDVHSLIICEKGTLERFKQLLRLGACDLLAGDFSEAALERRLLIAEHRSAFLKGELAQSAVSKREASQYRRIVKSWPQAAVVVPNLSRPIREVNSRALEILGLPESEVLGKYLSLLMPALFERQEVIPYEDFSKIPLRLEDVVYDGPKGPITLEVRLVGIEWGREGGVLVTFENLERLKAIERQRSRLSQVDTLRRFASEMAHEFNNALTVVNGNLALLEQMDLPEDGRGLLVSSLSACARASDMVKRLTQRPPEASPRVRALDPGEAVKRACAKVQRPKTLKPKIAVAENLWAMRADALLVDEMLVALINNAYEAYPKGLIEVDLDNVDLTEHSSVPLLPGKYVRIAVIDYGPGLSQEAKRRAFEPFFTTKTEAQGISLASVLEIARQHAGTIELEESPTGQGACVSLYLPASPVNPETTRSPRTAPPSENSDGIASRARRPRVLFMDDEPDLRTIVEMILKARGFEVTVTGSGEEAIQAYYASERQGARYDVLLLDLEVRGGMGARETVDLLRQDFPNLKAIVTTGYLDDVVLTNHQEHGFSGILTKPFQITDLVAVLEALCAIRPLPS